MSRSPSSLSLTRIIKLVRVAPAGFQCVVEDLDECVVLEYAVHEWCGFIEVQFVPACDNSVPPLELVSLVCRGADRRKYLLCSSYR